MIIVEGSDGAGKSTLVANLAEDLELGIGQRATKDRSKLYEVTQQDTYTALGAAVKADENPQIWDRLFFSEMVYAPIVGRDCEFSHEEQVFIKRVLGAMGCPLILCMPPFGVVKKNVEAAEQMEGVKEGLDHIYACYREMSNPAQWVLHYDYTGTETAANFKTYSQIVEVCKHYIEHRKRRSW